MVKLGLKPLKRNKRKYSSYKGTIGKIADNLIERDFNADKPNKNGIQMLQNLIFVERNVIYHQY